MHPGGGMVGRRGGVESRSRGGARAAAGGAGAKAEDWARARVASGDERAAKAVRPREGRRVEGWVEPGGTGKDWTSAGAGARGRGKEKPRLASKSRVAPKAREGGTEVAEGRGRAGRAVGTGASSPSEEFLSPPCVTPTYDITYMR